MPAFRESNTQPPPVGVSVDERKIYSEPGGHTGSRTSARLCLCHSDGVFPAPPPPPFHISGFWECWDRCTFRWSTADPHYCSLLTVRISAHHFPCAVRSGENTCIFSFLLRVAPHSQLNFKHIHITVNSATSEQAEQYGRNCLV